MAKKMWDRKFLLHPELDGVYEGEFLCKFIYFWNC